MLLDAIPHHLLQLLLVGHNRLRIRIIVASEPVEPFVDGLVPEFSWVILNAFEPHVAVFHLVRVSHLFGQRQLGRKRADGCLDTVALSHKSASHPDKRFEGPAQLTKAQGIVPLALVLQLSHRQFPSAFRTDIHQVLPVLALHWRRVNLIPHSTILSWHNYRFYLPANIRIISE